MLVVGAILSQLYKRQIAIANRVETYFDIEEGTEELKKQLGNKKNQKNIIPLQKIIANVKSVIDQRTPTVKKKILEKRLREAGNPHDMSPVDFRFLQLLIGVFLFLAIHLLLMNTDTNFISTLLMASIIGVLGAYYPSFNLSVIIKKRREEIQRMMPDFFDIVNLSIEAGMGLDAALLKVCKQTKGPLSEEFLQTLEDMSLGKSRREAFSDLRERVPIQQFQSIITSLIQADMLGVGMANVIRSLTERIREQRTQSAREKAMKAPVKMVFPMMLFIFPAIFIVMLGPLVIYLLQTIF